MSSRNTQPEPFHARQVEAMAGYGLPDDDIAHVLRIELEELRRLYAAELDDGRIKANSKVAECLFRKATGEGSQSVTAAIFWLKTRAQWRETTAHEVAGPGQEPIQIIISPEDAKLL